MIIKSISELTARRPLVTIGPAASVSEACRLLDRENIGALAVCDQGRLIGILSERDLIRRCFAQGKSADATRVTEVMTPDPVTLRRSASLAEALSCMLDGGFRHLPILDGAGEICGMISIRDIPTEYRLLVERSRGDAGERDEAAPGAPAAAAV